MDLDKAITFILEQQAQFNERQARHDERQAQFERGLNGLRKLVQMGMRMMVKTDAQLQALIDAQKRTDARLARTDARFERLMAALLQKRTNGRGQA